MEKESVKIIEDLEKQKAYHLDRIRRINIALEALKGEQPVESNEGISIHRKIKWKAEIRAIFKEHEKLTLDELRNKLTDNGITEANDEQYNRSIYSTLSRLVRDGFIEKIGHGVYRRENRLLDFAVGENE